MLGLLSLLLGLIAPAAHAADTAVSPQSANGITVLASRKVRDRVWEIDIATRMVGPHAHHGKLQVRVVLPKGYENARNKKRHYPVQYLLHGQGGRSSDWTDKSKIEAYTADKELILVTPEGGKGGWYTDWIHQNQGPQNLEEFHIHQLIGFIDQNFRTIASKAGRAITGFSMGGFGAMHYAGRHPELFAYASSYSGGLDLENQAVRVAVEGSALINNLRPLNGAFGTALWPNDVHWKTRNPVRMAPNYKGMEISLYTGNGLTGTKLDIIEMGAQDATRAFDNALTRAGVPHLAKYYANPGTLNGEPCSGQHDWPCVNGVYKEDLPRVMAALQPAG